jgi:hypothetical protein
LVGEPCERLGVVDVEEEELRSQGEDEQHIESTQRELTTQGEQGNDPDCEWSI